MIENQFLQYALLLAVGSVSGFINTLVGGGFLLLGCMALTGYDLVAGNAVKVFVAAGKVQLLPGLVLGAGNVAGALVGAKTTVTKGNRFVQMFVTVTILLFAALLFLR